MTKQKKVDPLSWFAADEEKTALQSAIDELRGQFMRHAAEERDSPRDPLDPFADVRAPSPQARRRIAWIDRGEGEEPSQREIAVLRIRQVAMLANAAAALLEMPEDSGYGLDEATRRKLEERWLRIWRNLRRTTTENLARQTLHDVIKLYAQEDSADATMVLRYFKLLFPQYGRLPLDKVTLALEAARRPRGRGGFHPAFHALLKTIGLHSRSNDPENTRALIRMSRRPRKTQRK